MKKLLAFMMAFALCFAFIGTFGFEDAHHDHSAHVIHADALDEEDDFVVPEYIWVEVGSAIYDELDKTFTVTFEIGSDTMSDIRAAVITIRTPNRVLARPSIQGGHCFGMWADDCAKVTKFTSSLSEITIALEDSAANSESASGNIVVEFEVNENYFLASRETYIQFDGYAVTVDGDTISYEPISAKSTVYVCSHADQDTRISIQPTCLTTGEEETYCTECGYVVSTKELLLADHKYDYSKPVSPKINPYQAPTCTAMGYGSFECLVCRKIHSATVPATGHKWTERYEKDGHYWVRCTSCLVEEYAENQCSHSKDSYKQLSVLQKSTCTKQGVALFQCPTCNQIEERNLPYSDHKVTQWQTRVEATCEKAGKKTGVCSNCAQTVTADIEALAHTPGSGWTVKTPATCTEPGVQVKKCTICGSECESQATAALQHNYDGALWTTLQTPTCITPGIQARTCQRTGCGFRETIDIPKVEHTYGSFVITVPATCTANGVQEKTCTTLNCGQKITEPIPMISHTYGDFVVIKEATCQTSGIKEKTCASCGHKVQEAIIQNPDNHKYGEVYVVTENSCLTDGLKQKKCVNEGCTHTEDVAYPAAGHKLGAAFTQDGITTRICYCGYREAVSSNKNGPVREYISGNGTLSIGGSFANMEYYWAFAAMDKTVAETVNGKTPFTFGYAYSFDLTQGATVGGANVATTGDMSLAIQLPAEYEGHAATVTVWRDASAQYPAEGFYPLTTTKTKNNTVTINGADLVGVTTIYIEKGEELKPDFFSPNILIPVIITVAVLAVAAVIIVIILVKKNKKKDLYSEKNLYEDRNFYEE